MITFFMDNFKVLSKTLNCLTLMKAYEVYEKYQAGEITKDEWNSFVKNMTKWHNDEPDDLMNFDENHDDYLNPREK